MSTIANSGSSNRVAQRALALKVHDAIGIQIAPMLRKGKSDNTIKRGMGSERISEIWYN
jgi:hypothetical protein